jgi:hypothetical protein
MNATLPLSTAPDPRVTRTVGWLIGLSFAAALIAVSHHPIAHGHDPALVLADIRRQAVPDRWVHGSLAAIYTGLTVAMVYLAMGIGLRRPSAIVGLVAQGLALVFMCQAVLIDGFIVPTLADRCAGAASAGCAPMTLGLLGYGGAQIEWSTRFALTAMAVAAGAWGLGLLRHGLGGKIAGGLGLASALGQIGLLFTLADRLTPPTLLQLLVLQAVWFGAVAVLMAGGFGPFRPQVSKA